MADMDRLAVQGRRAIGDGRIQRGDTIALVGTGAGLSAGGVVLRY